MNSSSDIQNAHREEHQPPDKPSVLPLVAAAIVLSLVAGLAGWWLGGRSGGLDELGQPRILTEFRLPTLAGRALGPDDFRGSVLVVDFWATWCTPCRYQTRILEEVYEEYGSGSGDVRLLAVSVGEPIETVREHHSSEPVPYPSLVDEKGRLMTEGNIQLLPTVMVLDRDGSIAFLRAGVTSKEKLRRVLADLLEESTG